MSQRVKALEGQYNVRKQSIVRMRRDLESEFTSALADLTIDELLEVAEGCGEEGDDSHCWRCKAWFLWVEADEAASDAAFEAARQGHDGS